jgi:hypothetical protein
MANRELRRSISVVAVIVFGLLVPISFYWTYCRVRLEFPRNARWQSVVARLSDAKYVPRKRTHQIMDHYGRINSYGKPSSVERKYVYAVEGRQFTVADRELYGLRQPVDEFVTLKYDPDDPRKATYDLYTYWYVTLAYGVFSCVALPFFIRDVRVQFRE